MNRTAWIALGVLALLVIWLVVDFKVAPAPRDPDSNAPVSEYVRVSVNEVKRIEVRRKDAPFVLVRQGKNWSFETPARYRANPKTVETWLKGILDATIDRPVEGKPGEMATYGLAQPAAELILTKDNGQVRTLQIGSEFKGGSGVGASYARAAGEDRLFMLAAGQVDDVAKKKVDDLRDKRLVDVEDEKSIQRVVIERPGGTEGAVEVIRRGEDKWELLRPIAAPADTFDMESLTRALRESESESFVENAATDLAKYGLDKPRLVVRVKDKNGEKAVLFGKALKDRVYTAREGENVVALVTAADFDNLNKRAADLRDKKLLTLERDRISYVELKNAHGTVQLQKAGGAAGAEWQRVKMGQRPEKAKGDVVQRIIDSVTSPATRHVDEAPADLAKYGLAVPQITVTVNAGSGTSQVYALGKKSPDGNYYVKGTGPAVFEAQPFVFEDLNVKPEGFNEAAAK